MKIVLQVLDRAEYAQILGLALHHGGLGDAAGLLEVLHRGDVLGPQFGRAAAQIELLLEHGYGIVAVGHAADYLRAHSLTVSLRLAVGGLSSALGVEQTSEDVHLPACGGGYLIGPAHVGDVKILGAGAVGRERQRGEIGQTRAQTVGCGNVDVELGVAQILVIVERLIN